MADLRFHPNPGHYPVEAVGKRVKVRLRDGTVPERAWVADGRSGCRWSLDRDNPSPFDIVQFALSE